MSVNLGKVPIKFFSCNVFIFENKTQTGNDKYCKIKLFGGAISHGASTEREAFLESSQTSTKSVMAKTVNGLSR